jgi:hypothetical protein
MASGALGEPSEQCDCPSELAQKDPEMAQDHADVVTAAAEHGEQCVASRFP